MPHPFLGRLRTLEIRVMHFISRGGYCAALILAVGAFMTGCSKESAAAKAPEQLTVEVAPVVQKDVPIYSEWIGTMEGFVNADIKAQVAGYLLKQEYVEG